MSSIRLSLVPALRSKFFSRSGLGWANCLWSLLTFFWHSCSSSSGEPIGVVNNILCMSGSCGASKERDKGRQQWPDSDMIRGTWSPKMCRESDLKSRTASAFLREERERSRGISHETTCVARMAWKFPIWIGMCTTRLLENIFLNLRLADSVNTDLRSFWLKESR